MEATQALTQELKDEFVGVCHGHVARAKELLQEHPGLATTNASFVETPIEAAAQMRQRELADLLLAAGAPLDICTAAVFGMADSVRAFLESDPKASQATGAHGIPVMYYPVVGGHKEIAELLLSHGADVNAGEGGTTALHGAAMFGQAEMARWLIEKGANEEAPNFEGKTALQVAEENGHEGVAKVLRGQA